MLGEHRQVDKPNVYSRAPRSPHCFDEQTTNPQRPRSRSPLTIAFLAYVFQSAGDSFHWLQFVISEPGGSSNLRTVDIHTPKPHDPYTKFWTQLSFSSSNTPVAAHTGIFGIWLSEQMEVRKGSTYWNLRAPFSVGRGFQ